VIGGHLVSLQRVRLASPASRTTRTDIGRNLDPVTKNEGFGDWARAHPVAVDVGIVALVLAVFEMPAFDPYRHAGGPVWPLWGLVVALPLYWRRRAPVPVFAVSLAGTVGALLTRTGPDWGGLSLTAILLGSSVALATAATVVSTTTSRRLAVVSAVAIIATSSTQRPTPDVVAAQLAVIAAAWLAGEAIKARRNEVALLHDRTARLAEQAADDERNRIARELHDVAAHHLSVIAVQAGAARLAAGDQSPSAGGLLIIEEASRQALTDLRRAVGVLRNDDRAGGIAPQPGLDQLDRLADRLRDAGLLLALTTTGDLSSLPEGIAVSAYRILQEALTNVLNHAGQVSTRVLIERTPAEIRLDVDNDGPMSGLSSQSNGGGGHGLVGMRERVAAYGGFLQASALPSGGFHVTARIPLP
jgi:signal transduction histidine kinase